MLIYVTLLSSIVSILSALLALHMTIILPRRYYAIGDVGQEIQTDGFSVVKLLNFMISSGYITDILFLF